MFLLVINDLIHFIKGIILKNELIIKENCMKECM